MPRAGEHAHVPARLGDEHLGGLGREPGNADQQFPGEAKGGHRILDPRVEATDIGTVSVDAVQEQPGHERVMLIEPADQRLGGGHASKAAANDHDAVLWFCRFGLLSALDMWSGQRAVNPAWVLGPRPLAPARRIFGEARMGQGRYRAIMLFVGRPSTE